MSLTKVRIVDDYSEVETKILSSQTVAGHTEYTILCRRSNGETGEENKTWQINKRYNDFCGIQSTLQDSGCALSLPKKKIVGNLEKDFIEERQRALQDMLASLSSSPTLSSNIAVRRFIDPQNYSVNFQEICLQHVSMALRSNARWELGAPLPGIGLRIRSCYFSVRDREEPGVGKVLQWADLGPFSALNLKTLASLAKSFANMEHPFIQRMEHIEGTETGVLLISRFSKEGTLQDILWKTKPKLQYLKKYPIEGRHRVLQLNDIRSVGWRLLKVLQFLHDKGVPWGGLHAGNIFLSQTGVEVGGVLNTSIGLSSKMRQLALHNKAACDSLYSLDVYCFGHMLYQLAVGAPLDAPVSSQFPDSCPDIIKSVLASILSLEASRGVLPGVEDLLATPLFSIQETLPSKPSLKLSASTKEALREAVSNWERRLQEDFQAIRVEKMEKKLGAKAEADSSSRRRSARQRLKNFGAEKVNGDGAVHLDTGETGSNCTALPATPTTPAPPPPPPPSPSPLSPPPLSPPAPPLPPSSPPPPPPSPAAPPFPAPSPSSGDSSRGSLLTSISAFNKAGLKKADTVDKSNSKI